ncbi:MAG: hypothetical protein QF752_06655 [Planctomycetota bacterium]|nr:hypothetical protein [Planctomycetota bacterium]
MVASKFYRTVLSLALGLCATALFSGCTRTQYDLVSDSKLYPSVDHYARSSNPGTVRVLFHEDLRSLEEKSRLNLGSQFILDDSWREPLAMSLIRIVQREMHESRIFNTSLQPAGSHDFLLELSLLHFQGVWHGGYWNLFLPWRDTSVSGRVALVVSIWDRKGKSLYFHREYDHTVAKTIAGYSNGKRPAVSSLGESLSWVIKQFLGDLEAEISSFPIPEEVGRGE